MFFRKLKNKIRRYTSYLLTAAILFTSMKIPSFAENSGSSYLNGWSVQCAWSSLSDTFQWNAVEEDIRQPKLVITYRLENAEREYPAGSLHFTIPGIGAADRASIVKADKIAADQEDSEWTYSWDQTNDLYLFTNKFTVAEGESVSGGFELLWGLNARSCENEYEQKRSPLFQIDGIGAVALHPLTYHFTSAKDRYRIDLYREKLNAADYETADKAYIWYDINTRFDKDWLSRGLDYSDYYVTVELPDGSDYESVIIQKNGKAIPLVPDENGNYGFYSFRHMSGDIGSAASTYYDVFTIGFQKETLLEQEVILRSHLNRLYLDESDWITKAGDNEIVDGELAFTIEDYDFTHEGYIYNHQKQNREYEAADHQAPSDYSDRLNAVNLYNGKIVQFYLEGSASRSYSLSSQRSAPSGKPSYALSSGSGRKKYAAASSSNASGHLDSSDASGHLGSSNASSHLDVSGYPNDTASSGASFSASVTEEIDGCRDWNNIRWWDCGLSDLSKNNDAWLDSPTYGEIHPIKSASPSDAANEEEQDREEGSFWFDFPLINDLFSMGNELFSQCFLKSYASETASETACEAVPKTIHGAASETFLKASPSQASSESSGSLPPAPSLQSSAAPTKPGGNISGISQIAENQEYSLVMGDDKAAIFLKDGSIRSLEDEEYDMAYIKIPKTVQAYPYEIYAASSQDTHFDDYHYYSSGTTDDEHVILLPPGIKAVFIRVNNITGSFSYGAYVGVRMHLNWTKEEENGSKAPDHENHFVNFSYLRALYTDEEGFEVNDCALTADEYLGTYGKELAERDLDIYQEQLLRDYSNVWLRSPITELRSETIFEPFTKTDGTDFSSQLTIRGTIQADNSGDLQKFSVYTVLPDGLQYDFDNHELIITGSGTGDGDNVIIDFSDHASISVREADGKRIIAADFDYSDAPLEISRPVYISMTFPVFLSYADYIMYGNRYNVVSYTMVHDDGHDKISGRAITPDYLDLDADGNTEEKAAYSNASEIIQDDVNEWREYVSKYVRSAYSGGYVTDTAARLFQESDAKEDAEKSNYTYRLDFCLGASNAKNITFYDRIEQGAVRKVNGDHSGEMITIPAGWQGRFLSVDTSKAKDLGLLPTIYYSTRADQEFDLSADGWSLSLPENHENVRSIAVHFDTSGLEGGVLKPKQPVYVLVNMQAPSDPALVGQYAVNQYTVSYEGYSILGEKETTYILPSSETRVRLLDTVGRIVLQKVDADHITGTNQDGTPKFSPLTGALFQIYDSSKKPLFTEPKPLNSLGRITLTNVPYGTYYWEELKAPEGYIREEGLHAFTIDGFSSTLILRNHRMGGTVTLTKYDADDTDSSPLSGAEYELYNSQGEQIFTDASYACSENGIIRSFTTDSSGRLTITNLPWGSYYFIETAAPDGYELHDRRLYFTISKSIYDKDKNCIAAEVTDQDEQKTASLLLKKEDELSGRPVKDALYNLYRTAPNENDDDLLIASGLKTNAAGELKVTDLKFGSYYFMEIRNPGGYQMPDEHHAVTDTVTLSPSTANQTITVRHTNTRKTGSVSLTKTDTNGLLVGGAEYELYHKGWADTDFSLYGIYQTGSEPSAGSFGIIEISDLLWGEYYFRETHAPQGCVLSDTPISFEINEETVQNTIYLNAVNDLEKGSIRLKKVDQSDPKTVLSGAVYELYRTDGSKCISGIDFLLPDGISSIETGIDGTITLSGLSQGGYYLKEITAPDSYSISSELIRFSITKENASVLQELTAEDEKDTAVITIRKKVNEVYQPFGNPAFLFKVVRSDGREYYRSVTLTEKELSGSVSLTVDQGFVYTITEIPAARYELENIIPGANVSVTGVTAEADLMTVKEADVTFINRLEKFDKFSHTSSVANLIKSTLKLTAIHAEYIGKAPITKDFPGYDTEKEQYLIPKEDLIVTAYFDDGTSAVIGASDYEVTPEAADGLTDTYTGNVSYTCSGITKSSAFQVETELPVPTPRYMVVFQLDGGYIFTEGSSSAQDSLQYQVKSGTAIDRPVNAPVKDGFDFSGWYLDPLYRKEAEFPLNISDNTTLYAKWEEAAVKVKYAVSVYGILKDTDESGRLTGLTFGPATGKPYVSSYKSHVPSAGQLCLHNLTWEEIISQCAQDPSKFRECMENGCTHSVELKITGKLAEGAVSYPYMTGDGASTLFHSINPEYRKWDKDIHAFDIGWHDSKIYATLNGKEEDGSDGTDHTDGELLMREEALIACLPAKLQHSITAKRNNYHKGTNDKPELISYDKLWLLRKDDTLPNRTAYKEDGAARDWWLRDLNYFRGNYIDIVGENGYFNFKGNNEMSESYHGINDCGISFGFCLPGPR